MRYERTLLAHTDGSVPNLRINVPKLDETFARRTFIGWSLNAAYPAIFWASIRLISPVLSYKHNMFALSGNPALKKEHDELTKRL